MPASRSRRGLSLLETVFACLLLTIVLGLVAMTWHVQERALLKSRQQNTALRICASKAEECDAAGLTQISDLVTTAPQPIAIERAIDGEVVRDSYTYEIAIFPDTEGEITAYMVTVRWESHTGPQDVKLEGTVAYCQ